MDPHLTGIPDETLRQLRDRAAPEGAYQMKRHPTDVRYSLMAALLHYRRMEVTDAIIGVFLQLVRRLEKKTDRTLEKEAAREIDKVYQKRQILYKVAVAATERPWDTVEEVLYPIVGGKDTFLKVIAEYEGRELVYEKRRAMEKKSKYTRSCRRMMKPVLETLVFRANNPALQPLLDGISLIKKFLAKKNYYYPKKEMVPLELLSGELRELAIEEDDGASRVVKYFFELGVLMKLEKALRCKEVWVEGAFRYRNPDQDLPQDWPEFRLNYYRQHQIPSRAEDFVEPIREELVQALKQADVFFSEKRDVYIYYPGQGEKGFFRIPKIVKGPEHPILQELKQRTVERWGIQDIADFLLEANRRVNFSRFFYSSAQRQVLTSAQIIERLLISILGRGTGLGLKRVHAATKPTFSYEDLIYFNKRFMHADSLREAIAALFNCILELRSPEIWGAIKACTSDGKYLGAWAQNLVAEWNSHYQQIGVLSYWHVDAKAAGIFSQIKGGSEVAAMIAGLIFHGTTMKIGSNYIDTRGQSELAFTFCRFLLVELCPWLKGMKRQRLALPDWEMKGCVPHLAGVLDDPIRWDFVYEQYDDMVRHVVAAKEMTGPIDSIIRRFNRNNPGHPAYKGFLELGQALRTIHDCKFLTDPNYRRQIHGGRNVIENWNSALDFINYAGKAELATNDPDTQEITVLCLHLLQNAIVLANTVMLERVLYDDGFLTRLKKDDLEALTPLFTSNVNPYGDIRIDLTKPSFLEVH
jgi:TnpA family transposase